MAKKETQPILPTEDACLISYYQDRSQRLELKRTNYLNVWSELAILTDPRNAYFRTTRPNGDLSQLIPKTDDTFQLLLPTHAAMMHSLLTPMAYRWHNFTFFSPELQQRYGYILDQTSEFLHSKRYSSRSGFVGAMSECYISMAVYGHCIMELTEDLRTRSVFYKALPIKEFCIDKDANGFVNTFYRKVQMTYRNLRTLFPGYTPDKYAGADSPRWLDETMELLCVVEPSLTTSGSYDNVWIDNTNRKILEKKVTKKCRYICSRSNVFPSSDDPYGFSPAMEVMPSMKALNSLSYNILKLGDNATRLDFLTGEDVVNPGNFAGNGNIIEGGINDEGRPMVQRLQYPDMPSADYVQKSYQERIKTALFVNFFMTLNETQSRSATDSMLKSNEKAQMVAPTGDRIARELLIPMIELELQYYGDMHQLPQFPEEIKSLGIATDFDITLDNPMLKGQRIDSANGIMTLAQYLGALMGLDTEINIDRAKMVLTEIFNIPASVLNTPEEKQSIVAEKARQQDIAMLAQNAGGIGSGVKDVAEAINMASGAQ